jgi:DNA-directed RNA polymerase subunit RPC12/RpoP
MSRPTDWACPTCGAEFDEPYIDQVQALSDDNFERCPECGSEVLVKGVTDE